MKLLKISGIGIATVLLLIGVFSFVDLGRIGGISAQLIASQQFALYEDCIKSFSEEKPSAFSITPVAVNQDGIDDALIQYKEGSQCGNAGCMFEMCVSKNPQTFVHVPFGFAAHSIVMKETITDGMHDLMLNGQSSLTMKWDGNAYALSSN